MKDKRFLKVKKVGEERYFRDARELMSFIEKQWGVTLGEACNFQSFSTEWGNKMCEKHNYNMTGEEYAKLNFQIRFPDAWNKQEYFAVGGFLFHIFYGYFERTSGNYTINILAEQNANNLCHNDLMKIIYHK